MTQDKRKKDKKKANKKAAKPPIKTLTDVFNQLNQTKFQIQQLQQQISSVGAMVEYLMNCNMVMVDYTNDMRAQIAIEKEIDDQAKKEAIEAFRDQMKDEKITEKKSYQQFYQEIKSKIVTARQESAKKDTKKTKEEAMTKAKAERIKQEKKLVPKPPTNDKK